MRLIIAEKPSVAGAIAEALGGCRKMAGWYESATCIISSGIGHLVKLDAPSAASEDRSLAVLPVIPEPFELSVISKTKDQFSLLKKLLARPEVEVVVNACDAGREGELIFRLIYEKSGCRKPIKRMWFQTMTKEGIRDAFNNLRPGAEFDNLYHEARCRSEADWIIGINCSRAITKLNEVQKGAYESMSAGRVQTPTEAILVDRELEIRHFVPKDYWELHGVFGARAGTYTGRWTLGSAAQAADEGDEVAAAGRRIESRVQAQALLQKCAGAAPESVRETSTKSVKHAPALFDITTLQRAANKKFKFSAKKTLDIAQALYEKYKATTYPRTDSSALPEDYVDSVRQTMTVLDARYSVHAQRILSRGWIRENDKRIFDNTKIADHFAIIPTLNDHYPQGMSEDETKIYDMVVLRFLAAFHPPAEYLVTQRVTVVAGELFKSSGRQLVERGWLEVYGQDDDDKQTTPSLCRVEPGEAVTNRGMDVKELQTKPPSRFTEDTLLGAMEGAGKLVDDEELRDAMKDRGLGTGATRASIIEGLLATKGGQGRPKEPYATREGKEQYLVPTGKGVQLIAFLRANDIESLTSPKMTGEWERKLRLVAKGECSRGAFMREIHTMAHHVIDIIKARAGDAAVSQAPQNALLATVACPRCAGSVPLTERVIECRDGCGFKLWREICGRTLSDTEIAVLLSKGGIDHLEGFISKAKKPFSAGLKLSPEFKTELVFQERGAAGAGEAPKAPKLADCPKCGNGAVSFRDGQFPMYSCENNDFKVYKTISGRALSDAEVKRLISHGVLPALEGFFSDRTKKKFKAGLKVSKDRSKVEFQFD